MPRSDWDDPPSARSKVNRSVVYLAAGICLLIGGVFGGLVGGLVGYQAHKADGKPTDERTSAVPAGKGAPKVAAAPAGQGAAISVPAAKVYDRNEFRDMLLGKSEDEVIAAVGRPDSTRDVGRTKVWYYANRTRDRASGKIDPQTQLVIQNGRVEYVNF